MKKKHPLRDAFFFAITGGIVLFFCQIFLSSFLFSEALFSTFLLPKVFASLFFFQSQKYEQVRWTCEPKPEKYPFFGKAEGAKEYGFKKKTMLKFSFIISSFRRLLSTFLLPDLPFIISFFQSLILNFSFAGAKKKSCKRKWLGPSKEYR